MKRYLSLALIVLMTPALLAVPAIADEVDSPYYDVLDYRYVNNGDSNNVVLYSGQTASFYLTSSRPLFYYDVLVFSTNKISYAYGWNGSVGSEPTVEYIGDNLYRIYGTFPGTWATYFSLEFTFATSDISYVNFHSCRVWNTLYDYSSTTVSGTVIAMGIPNQFLYPEYPSSPYVSWTYTDIHQYQGTHADGMFTGRFYFTDWQKFDFCEIQLNVIVKNISSVAAYLGDLVVPIEVSTIANADTLPGNFYINVVADLRSFQRNTTDDLTIVVNGIADYQMTNQISIFDALGRVQVSNPSPWLVWFNRLQIWLSSGFSSVTANLTTLGTNIGSWFTNQTTVFTNSVATWGQNLKDSIDSLPDKIAEALESVCVPSDSVVQDMGEQSEQLAQDRFGGAYEGALIVDEFASQLRPQQATQILTVPVVNLDILGVPFPLGGWEVDLVPDGSELIVENCKIIIDILATLAFINGVRNRLERTLDR